MRLFSGCILALALLASGMVEAQDCPSTATLTVNSSGYSGQFNIELRRGQRPGSRVISTRKMSGSGTVKFQDVCPGRYFFAFGTPDIEQVSVTRYFDITFDGYTYSTPVITVFYSRSSSDGAQRVGKAKKGDL